MENEEVDLGWKTTTPRVMTPGAVREWVDWARGRYQEARLNFDPEAMDTLLDRMNKQRKEMARLFFNRELGPEIWEDFNALLAKVRNAQPMPFGRTLQHTVLFPVTKKVRHETTHKTSPSCTTMAVLVPIVIVILVIILAGIWVFYHHLKRKGGGGNLPAHKSSDTYDDLKGSYHSFSETEYSPSHSSRSSDSDMNYESTDS